MPLFEILCICKGGGYRYCKTNPPHPKANSKGLYPLHRVLVENREGRVLDRSEHVHHKDGDHANDTVDNLEILTCAEHARRHRPALPPVTAVCGHCAAPLQMRRHVLRQRIARSASGIIYCSHRCSALANHSGFVAAAHEVR